MTKLKFSAAKIRFFFYFRIFLVVLLGLVAVFDLLIGKTNEGILFIFVFLLFLYSTFQYHNFFKIAKKKKTVELNVDTKRAIRIRLILSAVFLVFSVIFIYLATKTETVGYLPTKFWAVFFILLFLLMFWRIYQMKALMKKKRS